MDTRRLCTNIPLEVAVASREALVAHIALQQAYLAAFAVPLISFVHLQMTIY